MNQMFPRPRFWDEAARQDRTRFTLLGEYLILWLLLLIAMFGQSLLWSASLIPWMFGAKGSAVIAALSQDMSMDQAVIALVQALPDWVRILECLAYVSIGLTAIFYCHRIQGRSLASMGLRGSFLSEYALGLLVGALSFGAVFGLGMMTGAYRLNFSAVSDGQLGLVLCGFFANAVQAASVELLVHGYFAPTIGKRYPTLLALLVSSVVPAMLYSEATELFWENSLLLGLVLGVWVLKRGNLWGSCAFYGVWLFADNFLCCFATEGQHTGIYLLPVQIDAYRTTLTGGEAGPLGGICATVVLLGVLMLILPLQGRESVPPKPQQEEDSENIL
ncbi:MAG: hypothetical protein IIY70_03950 [Oscillospiraceae bacterium]|nr:hypothetical protein [Oscillospiraceae bacterium]